VIEGFSHRGIKRRELGMRRGFGRVVVRGGWLGSYIVWLQRENHTLRTVLTGDYSILDQA
jgi:hypothetical protein